MTTYRAVNAMWPEPYPVPTSREAIIGAKRLIRRAHRLAIEDGAVPKFAKLRPRKFKITSGNRYTEIRSGVWYVNPNQGNHWGWHQIVHGVSHWAQRHYWPQADGHGALHAWLEAELANYAITNFLGGQLGQEPKPKVVDKIAVRACGGSRQAHQGMGSKAQASGHSTPQTAQTGKILWTTDWTSRNSSGASRRPGTSKPSACGECGVRRAEKFGRW